MGNGHSTVNGKEGGSRRASGIDINGLKSQIGRGVPSNGVVINGNPNGSSSKAGMSRSASGTDINEKNYTQFVPVEKLAKVIFF